MKAWSMGRKGFPQKRGAGPGTWGCYFLSLAWSLKNACAAPDAKKKAPPMLDWHIRRLSLACQKREECEERAPPLHG